jgi:hypothetical protein
MARPTGSRRMRCLGWRGCEEGIIHISEKKDREDRISFVNFLDRQSPFLLALSRTLLSEEIDADRTTLTGEQEKKRSPTPRTSLPRFRSDSFLSPFVHSTHSARFAPFYRRSATPPLDNLHLLPRTPLRPSRAVGPSLRNLHHLHQLRSTAMASHSLVTSSELFYDGGR